MPFILKKALLVLRKALCKRSTEGWHGQPFAIGSDSPDGSYNYLGRPICLSLLQQAVVFAKHV
jgi:hypothetical protein